MEAREMDCIVCPLGCSLKVTKDENSDTGFNVTGNKCPRGQNYGIKEMTNPTRVITTTVKIKNAHLNRLPVRTNGDIPKTQIFEAMKIINDIVVTSPINAGAIVIKDILQTGVDIIASRSM